MNEFDEEVMIYVWPKGHEDGTPYPEDFYSRLAQGLASVGLAWESA